MSEENKGFFGWLMEEPSTAAIQKTKPVENNETEQDGKEESKAQEPALPENVDLVPSAGLENLGLPGLGLDFSSFLPSQEQIDGFLSHFTGEIEQAVSNGVKKAFADIEASRNKPENVPAENE